MLTSALPIPENLKQHYLASGIVELYPPQAECVQTGMLEGKNLLVSIPTASGKTLIAEMAMHTHIAKKGKCLYIVPLKALASEKFDEFEGKGVRIGIATGDFDRRDDSLGRNDIIVATSEKVDSLLRNRARWISDITLLVIDEIHLIDSENRGPTLEMVIAKLRYRNPAMQVIGLSATIGNPQLLAGWLDAELVTSTWRPVDLRQGVFWNNRIHFRGGRSPGQTGIEELRGPQPLPGYHCRGRAVPGLCLLAPECRGICQTGCRGDQERGSGTQGLRRPARCHC